MQRNSNQVVILPALQKLSYALALLALTGGPSLLASGLTTSTCIYALDSSAQRAFQIAGATSVTSACSAVVESTSSAGFEMEGSETFYLQDHSQVGVVGGAQFNGQTSLVDTISNITVQPVTITSPGDPLSSVAAPTTGTIVRGSPTNYDQNNKPANNTLSPGVYCGGLTIGNTNGATFTMSPGTYIMAGGGLTMNSQAIVGGTGVTVYNTTSSGWGCSSSYSYTPLTISGQANITLSAPTSGALAGILFFGDRNACSSAGSCTNQINGGSTTNFNGALYFKKDKLLFSGANSSTGFMMLVADLIEINGNSTIGNNGNPFNGISVSVTPASASLYGGQTQQFSATVANSGNQAVTWTISPSSGAGSISASGLYTAPTTITAQQTVTVTATSQADTTKTATATITLFPPVTISVSPATAALYSGQSQQFTATVIDATNTSVVWSLSSGGAGTITAGGLYTAPSSITGQQTVTVIVTSVANTSVFASATVTLLPPISVSVTPAATTLYAGQTQAFMAAVANSSNQSVTWTISPATGAGTISSGGVYTAPASIAATTTVTVTATSAANSSATGTATITLSPPISVSVTPAAATLYASQTQAFTASVANSTNQSVTWSITPATGAGTINSSGLYTAPATITATTMVTVTATSAANTSATGTATITLSPPISVSVTPATATLYASQTQAFAASVAFSSNQSVTWTIAPATGAGTISSTGVYTAPASISATTTVTVTATSAANSSATGTATITLSPPISVSVTPATATLYASQTQAFTANVAFSTNQSVTWTISPATGAGTISSSGVYTAPASIAATTTVTVTATSAANSSATGTATITLSPPISVSVTPATATLYASQTQAFTANVANSTNQSVTWSIAPATGAGTISSTGVYTAPASIAATTTVTVTATSAANTSATGTATITLSPPISVSVTPATATLYASQTQAFTANVAFSTNQSVTWTISPATGAGTISSSGVYTAPASITNATTVTVTATSAANSSATGTATITLSPPISVSVTPATATLYASQTQAFTANVAFSTNQSVTWAISPATGAGTISSTGVYTAPASITATTTVTVTATSAANSSTTGTATITLSPPVSVSVNPATTTLYASQTQAFTANVAFSTNQSVTWTISPATGAGTISSTGVYTAPASITATTTVMVTATSAANTSATGTGTITLSPPISVSVTPATATLFASQTQAFMAMVANSTNQSVTWTIFPATGAGTISSAGLYTAPTSVSSQQTVTVTVTSSADPTKTSTATITLSPAVTTGLTPSIVTLAAGQTQQFAVSFTGNPAVAWSVSPSGTGSITSSGLYTAPNCITTQQTVTITATNTTNPSQTASATVTLTVSSNAYSYHSAITIDHTKVQANLRKTGTNDATEHPLGVSSAGTDQTNFPLLISGTFSFLATTANGGNVQNANGYDIIFTDPTGAIQYNHEIESYNPTTGQLIAWVQIPSLSASTDTVLNMWYGNGAITTSQANPTGVWPTGESVYHLANVTGPTASDSTGNSDAAILNNVSPATGQIDGAGQFNGINSYLAIPPRSSGGGGNFSVWLKTTGTGTVIGETDGTLPGGTPAPDGFTSILYIDANGLIHATGTEETGNTTGDVIGPKVNDGQWHLISYQADLELRTEARSASVAHVSSFPAPLQVTLYVDGQLIGSNMAVGVTGYSSATSYSFFLGAGYTASASGPGTWSYFNGVFDEFRIFDSSAPLVVFNNQASPGTFAALSSPSTASSTSLLISPAGLFLGPGQTQQLTVTPLGTCLPVIAWSIAQPAAGSIDPASGLYTAPATISTFTTDTVTATNPNAPSMTGLTTIELDSTSVFVSPNSPQLYAGQTQQFTASVRNGNTAVTWSLQAPAAGTISSAGLYTAPASIASSEPDTVIATSVADGTTGLAFIDLEPPIQVSVSPSSATLFGGQTQIFTASVANASNTAVTWSISPSTVGAISGSGFYTAPLSVTTSRTVTIIATSVANPAVSGSVTINLITAAAFSHHRTIVVDHTKIPNTDQANFPVLISGTYSFLANAANGGAVQNQNGFDIVFTSDCAGGTILPHEIESYDPTTGQFIAWVNVPALSHTADTPLYMWYGNSQITTTLEQPTKVWASNFYAVLHLDKNGNVSTLDSTGRASSGSGLTPVAGIFGEAAAFTNSSTVFENGFQFLNPPGATISTWFNTFSGGRLMEVGSLAFVDFGGLSFSVNTSGVNAAQNLNDGSWHYAVGTADANELRLYVDGALVASDPPSPGFSINDVQLGQNDYSGSLQEVRISTVSRSADWIATEFNNQSSPATFYTVYPENTTALVLSPLETLVSSAGTAQFSATEIGVCTSNPVTWSISPTVGAIGTTGLYTAPASVAMVQEITVTATVATTPPLSSTATIVLEPPATVAPVSVSVTPGSITLYSNNTQQFIAALANTASTAVNWSISPSATGSISANGLYTAPSSITAPQVVTITATSQSQPSQTGSAIVMLTPGLGSPIVNSPFGSALNLAAQSLCRGPQAAPAVTAGIDQLINLSGGTVSTTLTGSVSNYTLPPGQSLTHSWSQISGPAPVQFAPLNAPSTQATFSAAGIYILQLSVSNTVLTSSAQVQVTVAPALSAASTSLLITPAISGPNAVGSQLTLQFEGQNLGGPGTVQVTGANPQTVNFTLNGNDPATFTYRGTNSGTDTIVAMVQGVTSNTVTVTWIAAPPSLSTSPVVGQFFAADGSGVFNTPNSAQPLFSQTFPSIDFNPAAGAVNGSTTVTNTTRPFTEVVTDRFANFAGTVAAQGNGYQAGLGSLGNFSAVFTGYLNIPAAGQVTFAFSSDDAFIFGAGNGALPVSGPQINTPINTAFQNYPVMGGVNQRSAPASNSITVNFPAPGVYPYEVDYAKGGDNNLTLTMTANGSPIPAAVLLTMTPSSVPSTTTGQVLAFNIAASDPNGVALANMPVVVNVTGVNPETVALTTDATGQVSFGYAGLAFGTDIVQAQLSGNDGAAYSNAINVTWNSGVNQAPTVEAGPSQTTTLANPVTLSGVVSDDGLPNDTLAITWSMVSGPGTVTFAYPNQVMTTATFSAVGTYVLQLSAFDGALTTNSMVTIIVIANPQWASGWLASPINGITLSSPTPITLIPGITLTSGTLSIYPASNPSAVTVLSSNTTGSGQIGTFDPTLLSNGSYFVDLRATNSAGVTQDNLALVKVVGDYKPGRVTATITDFTVPAPGLPIQIQRTYDSLVRSTSADFGYGWTLGVNIQTDISPTGDVTLTLNGRRRTFYFTPPANPVFVFFYTPQYTPEPGLYGSLVNTGDNCSGVLVSVGNIWQCAIANAGSGYQPTGFQYTDAYGRVYTMSASGELQSVQDLNGNTLTVAPSGITSSSGLSVPFVRDSQGRITQITDTAGNTYAYGYDANGNLASVTYPSVTAPTQYEYDPTHLLTQETDRRGNIAGLTTYYPDGKLQSVTDATGNTTLYAYNLAANTTTVTNPDGGAIVSVVDTYGSPLSVTDPLGRTTLASYDSNHNMVTLTSPAGNTVVYAYTPQGLVSSVTDPLNQKATASYNALGMPTSNTDGNGKVSTATYDGSGRLTSISDSLGQLVALTWNSQGNPVSATDGDQQTTQFTYDSAGNQTSVLNALGYQTSFTYNLMGNRLSETRPGGGVTSHTYDALGRLLSTTNPANNVDSSDPNARPQVTKRAVANATVTYQYDANGNLINETDPLGNSTSYVYDAANRVIQISYADGTSRYITYDFRGHPQEVTQPNGRVDRFDYDLAGQLITQTFGYGLPSAMVTKYGYTTDGHVGSTTDPRGNVTTLSYDPDGRLTQSSDSIGILTAYGYDGMGRMTQITNGVGAVTTFAYDDRGKPVSVTYPDQSTRTTTYDALGDVLSQTDQAGVVTAFGYDALGQVIAVTDPLGGATSYSYDADGNLTAQTDANGHTTTYTYDSRGFRLTRILPSGAEQMFAYDLAGNLISLTDAAGRTSTFGYDSMNRLASRTPPTGSNETAIAYSYSATGKLATMSDATGSTSYTYDPLDRLIAKMTGQGALSYSYEAGGLVATLQSSNLGGANVSYQYDARGRLTSVVDNQASALTQYSYDNESRLVTASLPNGVQLTYSADSQDRITNLAQALPQAGTGSYSYSYAIGGTIGAISEPTGRTLTPIYDQAYRLLNETLHGGGANGAISYSLDRVGNRLSRSSTVSAIPSGAATYDLDDQLVGLSWDPNGNLLSDGIRTFTYDSRNRLTGFRNSGSSATFAVDGVGERVAKSVNGTTTGYLVDDLSPTGFPQVVEEVSGGTVLRRYTYGLSRISMTNVASAVASYYLHDISGNVRGLTDANGNVTDSYEYDSYGNLLVHNGQTSNDYLYRGERFDAESSLYYLRARYYDPMSGRFITPDEFEGTQEDPRTLNRYSYGKSNPLSWSDPSGFDAEGVAIASQVAQKATQFFIVSIEFGGGTNLAAPGPLFNPSPFVEGALTGALGYIAACLIVRGVSELGLLDGVNVNPLLRTGIGAFDSICQASLPLQKSPKKPPQPTIVAAPAPTGPGRKPPIGYAPSNPCKTPLYFVGPHSLVSFLNKVYDPGCFQAHHSPQWKWADIYQSLENLPEATYGSAPAISLPKDEHGRLSTQQRQWGGFGDMYLQILYDAAEVQLYTGAPPPNVDALVLFGLLTWQLQ